MRKFSTLAATLALAACGNGASTTSSELTTSRGASPTTTTAVSGASPTPTTAPIVDTPRTTVAPAPTTTAPATTAPATRCIVRLHGKGGGGGPTTSGPGGVKNVNPGGNAPGWNGRQWLYYPDSGYTAARDIVARAIADEGCGRTIVKGFSNGASFAAKLACRNERFGNTVIGYIVDDPVVDRAVEGCARGDLKVALYWTGDINQPPGWDCIKPDWTCEGGVAIGIDAYQRALGVERTQSPHRSHREYSDPPELQSWW